MEHVRCLRCRYILTIVATLEVPKTPGIKCPMCGMVFFIKLS